MLYHYTTWEAAESILRSRRFRASAHDCTNDPDELATADAMILEAVGLARQTAKGVVAKRVLGLFHEHYAAIRLGASRRAYLVCFSAAHDDARQWLRYGAGGAGVCLGVRLLSTPTPRINGVATAIMPVEYGEAIVRGKVDAWIERYTQIMEDAADNEHNWRLALRALEVSSGAWALGCKHVKWESEQETRMIFLAREGTRINPTVETRPNGTIKRYCTVPVTTLSRIPIDEFMIGPNQDVAGGCHRALKLLEEIGYPHAADKVRVSSSDLSAASA